MRSALAVLAVCLAVPWATALVLWPSLPARIPIHFDLQGHPDRIVERTWLTWLLLPLVATALSALFAGLAVGLGAMARRWPAAINLPGKRQFLALPADARERVVRPSAQMLLACAAVLDLMFGAMLLGTAQVAGGRWQTLSPWTMAPFMAALGVVVAAGLWSSVRAVRREVGGGTDLPVGGG